MPTKLVKLFDPAAPFAGLWLTGGKDKVPSGALRRARGIHKFYSNSLRSRQGSTLITALDAHSLYRFGDVRFQGSGTILSRAGSSILTGLDGNRLSFLRMPPSLQSTLAATPVADSLFVTGGGLVRKIDSAGAVTNWGIAIPSTGVTAASDAVNTRTIDLMETAAGWSSSGATLSDETTIRQEGTNSMKMSVGINTTGIAEKAITVDLATFAAAPTASPDADFIEVWVFIDDPREVRYIQIAFDVGTGNFSEDFYTYTIPIGPQDPTAILGVASLQNISEQENLFLGRSEDGLVSIGETNDILKNLGRTEVSLDDNTWTQLRIPKQLFARSGDSSNTWADVDRVRLTMRVRSTNTVIIYWDQLRLVGGRGLQGRYRYHVTFRNSTTGHRSNANATATEVTDVARQSVALTDIPTSTDGQVDQREIWRTVGDGTLFFRITTISDNSTTTFTDTVADFDGLFAGATVMENLELPIDNIPPEATYDYVTGPYAGRAWWTRDSVAGARGRIYFSPIGRPEGVAGFLEPTDDDDPMQTLVIWNGALYGFSESRVFQVVGTTVPFITREVFGVPGTTSPFTAKPTPSGIPYRANDGSIRLFNGSSAPLMGFDAMSNVFNGETSENISTAFNGVVAASDGPEYLISDAANATLIYNFKAGTWRDLGVSLKGIYYEEDTGLIIATISESVVILEADTILLDNSVNIEYEIETGSVRLDEGSSPVIQRIYLDMNPSSQTITPSIVVDGTVTAQTTINDSARVMTEIPIHLDGRSVGLRVAGSLTAQVEIFGISADVYYGE